MRIHTRGDASGIKHSFELIYFCFVLYQVRVSLYLPERHFLRQPKARAKHALLGRYIAHIMDIDIGCFWRHLALQLSRYLGAYLFRLGDVVVALGAEAVHVDHGELLLRVWREELLGLGDGQAGDVGVQADEGGEEGDCGRGQVHDVVLERAWLDECPVRHWFLRWWCASRELDLGVYWDRTFALEQVDCRLPDEVCTISVARRHKVSHFVDADVVLQRFVALGVEVVGPYEALLLSRRYGEGSHAGHDVAYRLALAEQVAEPLVFSVQSCVPIDLCKVKLERAALFTQLDVHVVGPMQHFVLKCAESILCSDVVQLVDDCLDHGVLVRQHVCDEVFVRPVSLAQVQVRNMASQREALGYLVILLRLGRRYYGARDLRVCEEVVVEVELEGYDAQSAVLFEVAQLRAPRGAICLLFRLSMSGRREQCQTYRCEPPLAAAPSICRPSAPSPNPRPA
jgi:hypothetical protein